MQLSGICKPVVREAGGIPCAGAQSLIERMRLAQAVTSMRLPSGSSTTHS